MLPANALQRGLAAGPRRAPQEDNLFFDLRHNTNQPASIQMQHSLEVSECQLLLSYRGAWLAVVGGWAHSCSSSPVLACLLNLLQHPAA